LPKVTRITEQVKNKDRISIYVDGVYSVSLTMSQLLDEKLKVGDDLSDQDIKRLHKLSDEGKLRMRTLEWLMIRPRSAKELHGYLRRKNLEPDQIDSWIDSMQKVGYQNDINFARWWAEQRRNKQRSAGYIRQELRSKGVDQEIINTTLVENQTSDNDALKQLIEKKRRNVRYQDDKKLTEYLQRQGYRYSDIVDVLAE
jgi:regulatory protein